jgi:hypothetical protein
MASISKAGHAVTVVDDQFFFDVNPSSVDAAMRTQSHTIEAEPNRFVPSGRSSIPALKLISGGVQ